MALFVAAAVVSAWRGAWVLLDAILLPEKPMASAAASLGMGSAGFVACAAFQPLLIQTAQGLKGHGVLLSFVEALYSYAGLWVCVTVWRGVWYLWDHWQGIGAAASTLDGSLAVQAIISHVVGVVLLLPIRALRNLNAPPMLIGSDVSSPYLGARTTVGVRLLLPGLRNLSSTPAVQPPEEWRAAVGLPALASKRSAYTDQPFPISVA